MSDDDKQRPLEYGAAISPQSPGLPFSGVTKLGQAFDLSSLSNEERNSLTSQYALGLLDVEKKAAEMHLDVGAFQAMLRVMSQNTKDISDATGTSVTMQHTHQSSVGRTEIIMGNTSQAARGKLSKTITGDRDMSLWYYIVGAAVLVIIVLAVAHR